MEQDRVNGPREEDEAGQADFDAAIAAVDPGDPRVTDRYFAGVCGAENGFKHIEFVNVSFERCRFEQGDFTDAAFYDCGFVDCDLANADFTDGYFKNCKLTGCRADGARFQNVRVKDTSLERVSLMYANLGDTVWDGCELKDVNLREAYWVSSKIKRTKFEGVDLTRVDFQNTPLKGQNFSGCTIAGIAVSDNLHELRGLKLSPMQATELMPLIGVKLV